ncbi:MAG: helix-turn-helix transcriptional regulator [Actinomycetales bacterium]|nr:helix-turn-helix transcriptional regulator [Actinomycetales bacterium]
MTRTISWEQMKAERPIPPEVLAAAVEAQYARIRGYNLKELRTSCEYTQVELAKEINVSQAMISKLERGDISSAQISTLQRYVEALGGKLRISAEFGDKAYLLS